jgi:hypothetical protein
MHKYGGTMGFQRLIKAVKNTGTPGPDSVGTSQIINGTITTADISNGAITQEKFSPELQLALATFSQQLYNLENPGFYGIVRFKNDNNSDNEATLTITVESRYFNQATNSIETQTLLPVPETITKNHHYDITIPIGNRLTNTDTILRMYYTINKNDIEVDASDIIEESDKGSDGNGNYYDLSFDGSYDDINGGDAEISFIVADNI